MSSDPPSGGPSATPDPGESERRVGELAPARADVVATLGATLLEGLERHLPGARAHAESTAQFAFRAAAGIGLSREQAALVRETATLHDIGMVYVPVDVLRKPRAQLTDDDRGLLAGHIESGSRLALGAGIPADVCEWILNTRERWDGAGPAGLAGDAIPIESRIVRVACAADLMLGNAGAAATIAGLRVAAGSELDPLVVELVAAQLRRVGST